MKKVLCLLLVSILLLSLGAPALASAEKTNLLLWLPPFGTGDTLDFEFWTKTLTPWAEKNNVNLSIEITPWGGYEEKYLTGFSSGQGPDVGYMYLEMFNDFIQMDALADVGSYFTAEEKDNYLYFDKGMMKGGQYAIPFIVGNARMPFFNMDLLKKAQIDKLPETWDELIAVATKIKEANLGDVIPFAQEWADPAIGALNNIFYPYLWQAGGEIYNADGSKVALLDNGAAVEAAQFLYDLKFKHNLIPDECLAMKGTDVRDQFAAGRVAIASMAANSGAILTKAGINWQSIPSFTNKTKAIWVASDALIVNKASKNTELAVSLVKFITSADVMSSFHKEVSSFPPITKDEPYNDNPAFKDMYEKDTAFFRTLPVANGAFKVMDTLYKNLQLMMLGSLSPEDAIKNTVEYFNSIQ